MKAYHKDTCHALGIRACVLKDVSILAWAVRGDGEAGWGHVDTHTPLTPPWRRSMCLGIWEKACQPKIRKVHQRFSTSVKFEVNTTWNSFQKLFWRCVFISIQALFVHSVSGYWKLSQARLSAGYQAFRSNWHPTSACPEQFSPWSIPRAVVEMWGKWDVGNALRFLGRKVEFLLTR